MTRSGREIRPGSRPLRVVIRVAVVVALVGLFEFLLYEAALISFSHIDTPTCAGANTFCSPQGGTGLTGGAIVFAVGNLVALIVGVLLLIFLVRRSSTR